MSKRLIVITGAAGMIGSGVVRHFNDQGHHELILVDDLKEGVKWKNLLGKQFIDLISKHSLFDWLKRNEEGIDAIIHLGACSDTVETNTDYLIENNYRYTIRLAEWALSRNKRFIYASSAATYGDGKRGFIDDEEAIEELRPLNPYAFSKQLVDLWMKREKAFGKVVGLKYFNVFGPNEYHKGRMASMVLKMAKKAKEEGVIQLYKSNEDRFKDGDQCRDFIYVKEAAAITCHFVDPKFRSACGLFNVGQGQVTTWNQLACALFKALGKPARIEYIDMPPELSKQYQNYTCAEMKKLHALLPKETISIEDSVRDYVRNYLLLDARW